MTQGNPKFFPPTLNSYIVLNVMLLSKNERIMCKRKELINKTKHNTTQHNTTQHNTTKAKAKAKEKKSQNDREQESANLIVMWALHPFGLPPKKRLVPQPDLDPCPFYSMYFGSKSGNSSISYIGKFSQ